MVLARHARKELFGLQISNDVSESSGDRSTTQLPAGFIERFRNTLQRFVKSIC
jgi:hypothetical protein